MPRNPNEKRTGWTPRYKRIPANIGEDFARHLGETLALETPTDHEQGDVWYPDALTFCRSLSARHDKPLDTIIDAVAAASPRKAWTANQRAIEIALATGAVPTVGHEALMGKNRRKVESILFNGATLAEVMAVSAIDGKVENFADSIRAAGQTDRVCIDSHIMNALHYGKAPASITNCMFQTQWLYDLCASAVRDFARLHHERPAIMQARLWVVAKRLWGEKGK